MDALVDFSTRKTMENKLEKEKYTKIGSNGFIVIEPNVLHFPGFQIGKTYELKVRVVNSSLESTRVHLFYPSENSAFQATCDKKGMIVPGMAEVIKVAFTPKKHMYYYDCIKVHHGHGNVLIPIHGYPVMNKIDFPKLLDFGKVGLSQTALKSIRLQCTVPIEFEYKIVITKSHADMKVTPLSGMIPANGNVEVVVEYCPKRMVSASMEMELHVAQINFTPMKCCVMAHCASMMNMSVNQSQEVKSVQQGDVVKTNKLDYSTKKVLKKGRLKASAIVKKESDVVPEDIVEGLKIPLNMTGTAPTNFVLTQQPGKLKPKDLKVAIEKQRKSRSAQLEQQEALRKSTGGGRLCFDTIVLEEMNTSSETTRQLKELAFLQDIQDIDKKEKQTKFQSQHDCLGDTVMTDEQLAYLHQIRQHVEKAKLVQERNILRNTYDSNAFGILSTVPQRVSTRIEYTPSESPDFDVFKNNMWGKRKRVVHRFVSAVSTCIIRIRAMNRLHKIKACIANATTRAEVRAIVEEDWKYAQVPGECTIVDSLCANDIAIPLERTAYPKFIKVEEKTRHTYEISVPQTFYDMEPYPVQLADESSLLGYQEIPLPAVTMYFPSQHDRHLREGAAYEKGIRAPQKLDLDCSDSLPEGVPMIDIHERLDPALFTTFQLEDPATTLIAERNTPVYVEHAQYRETDDGYVLRPQIIEMNDHRTHGDILRSTVGTFSVGSLRVHPEVSTLWQESRKAPLSALSGLNDGNSLWDVANLPPLLDASTFEQLSDSESDNEIENKTKTPTMEDAISLFSNNFKPPTFRRYEKLIELERQANQRRKHLRDRLTNKMKEFADTIQHPMNKFVLEGHGTSIPLHNMR